MEKQQTRRRFLAGGGAVLSGLLAGCFGWGEERESFERSVDVGGATELAVDTAIGDVAIRSAERGDVHVDGVKIAGDRDGLDDVELGDRRDGDRLVLEADVDESGLLPFSLGPQPGFGELVLEIPESLAVERVDTTTGRIDVEDVAGGVHADATTGDVSLVDVAEPVSVDVTTGSVTVDGGVEAIDTTTGDVDATMRSVTDEVAVDTTTGDVTAALAPALDVAVTVETNTGDLTVGEGFEDVSVTDDELEFTVGEGTSTLEIGTTTGDVTIESVEE